MPPTAIKESGITVVLRCQWPVPSKKAENAILRRFQRTHCSQARYYYVRSTASWSCSFESSDSCCRQARIIGISGHARTRFIVHSPQALPCDQGVLIQMRGSSQSEGCFPGILKLCIHKLTL